MSVVAPTETFSSPTLCTLTVYVFPSSRLLKWTQQRPPVQDLLTSVTDDTEEREGGARGGEVEEGEGEGVVEGGEGEGEDVEEGEVDAMGEGEGE